MNDADYRELLAKFDATSCTALTSWQADRMIAMLRERGFVPTKASKRANIDGVVSLPSKRQMALIEVLKANIYWEVSFEAWLKKFFKTERVTTKALARKVIEGLKAMVGIDTEIIELRALPFPLMLDEERFITKHGEILPYIWVYDLDTKKLLKVENKEYTI